MEIHKDSKNYSRFCHSEETIIKISMNILPDISLFYIHMLIYAYCFISTEHNYSYILFYKFYLYSVLDIFPC